MAAPKAELEAVRRAIRSGEIATTTSGLAPGILQANLVILPSSLASDFRRFCERNPAPCPLIEQTPPGCPRPPSSAPSADLRTDAPRYRVYRRGELVDEPLELRDLWRDDFVGFLLGCSFSFEHALAREGVPLRHQEERKTVPMYVTDRPCRSVGSFSGPLVVSMRPIRRDDVARVRDITARFPHAHGAPVHAGEPSAMGIDDLDAPEYGQAVTVRDGETPVFWACGVTPQAVARAARLELLITHAPGCMFLTDLFEDPSFPGRVRRI